MNVFLQAFPIFLLIFCRITSFFVVAPIFSAKGVPNMFKVGLGFFLSIIVYLAYGIGESVPMDSTYLLFVVREILAGVLLGFVVYLFFVVVQISGALIDLQMGFGMANIVDPMTGASAPLTGNFKYWVLLVIFLSMNGHHYLLNALMHSYEWIPLSNDLFARIHDGSISEFVTKTVVMVFMLGFQLAAPIVVSMFLTDVGLGFLAKTAPQFNVFVIGMPLKILVGMLIMILTMPSMATLFSYLFSEMFDSLEQLFAIVKG